MKGTFGVFTEVWTRLSLTFVHINTRAVCGHLVPVITTTCVGAAGVDTRLLTRLGCVTLVDVITPVPFSGQAVTRVTVAVVAQGLIPAPLLTLVYVVEAFINSLTQKPERGSTGVITQHIIICVNIHATRCVFFHRFTIVVRISSCPNVLIETFVFPVELIIPIFIIILSYNLYPKVNIVLYVVNVLGDILEFNVCIEQGQLGEDLSAVVSCRLFAGGTFR